MCKGVVIFSLMSVVVGFGFAVTLAIKTPKAGATESFASTGSHVISTESLSPIFYKRFCRSTKELLDDNGHIVPNFYSVDRSC